MQLLNLFVLRHGEAGARMDSAEGDAERHLTPAGRKEISDIADFVASLKIEFKVIGASPLNRALETAEIVARRLRELKRLEQWDELKPTSDIASLFQKVSRLGSRAQVIVVGHEPYLSGVIGEVIGGKAGLNLVLKKGGLAKVRVNGFKPTISGELRWLLTPKLIRKMV